MGKLKNIILGALIGTIAVGMTPTYVYANETINARVEARYSSNRISWNKVGDYDKYNVYRICLLYTSICIYMGQTLDLEYNKKIYFKTSIKATI